MPRDHKHGFARSLKSVAVWAILVSIVGLAYITASGSWQDWGASTGHAQGGSTIPISPPERPTPIIGTPTPNASPTTANPTAAPSTDIAAAEFDLNSFRLNLAAVVHASDGSIVTVLDREIGISGASSGSRHISMPLALESGKTLASFQDGTSGIGWEADQSRPGTGTLVLPLPGGWASIVLTVRDLHGQGSSAEGEIERAEVMLGPLVVSAAGGESGEVVISAELLQLPNRANVLFQAIPPSTPDLASSMKQAADASGARIVSTAYVFKVGVVSPSNEDVSLARSASIVMKVRSHWVQALTGKQVRIIRVASSQAQVLDTQDSGEDARGMESFYAVSPDGLSSFALVALDHASTAIPENNSHTAVWVVIGLVVVAAGAMGLGARLILRKKSSK